MTSITDDYESFFNQALESEKGIAIDLDSPGQAIHFISKMNQFRFRQRKKAKDIYPLDHPMHNKTPWDILTLRADKENPCSVLISRATMTVKAVRAL